MVRYVFPGPTSSVAARKLAAANSSPTKKSNVFFMMIGFYVNV
jgi:hypothetical protein